MFEWRFGHSALPILPYTQNMGALCIVHGCYRSSLDAFVYDNQEMTHGAGASSIAALKRNLPAKSLKILHGYPDRQRIRGREKGQRQFPLHSCRPALPSSHFVGSAGSY